MSTVNVGIVSPVIKGAWDDEAAYNRLNIVQGPDGTTYQAIQAVPAGTALSNTSYWMQITPKAPTIGTVTDVAFDAGASVTNSGTGMAPVWDFEIPRGVTGNESIDDTAGDGDDDVVWSADKSYKEIANSKSSLFYKKYIPGVFVPGSYKADTGHEITNSARICSKAFPQKVANIDIADGYKLALNCYGKDLSYKGNWNFVTKTFTTTSSEQCWKGGKEVLTGVPVEDTLCRLLLKRTDGEDLEPEEADSNILYSCRADLDEQYEDYVISNYLLPGTIATATGLYSKSDLNTRIALVYYYDIDYFNYIFTASHNYDTAGSGRVPFVVAMLYDKDYNFLARYTESSVYWLSKIKKATVVANYPNAKYLRFIFCIKGGNISNNFYAKYITLSYDYKADFARIIDNRHATFDDSSITSKRYKYYGEKIDLQNQIGYKAILNFETVYQSGCSYNDKLLAFKANGTFNIYSLTEENESVVDYYLDQYQDIKPHCNTACFSKEKYDVDDEFPLVYLNAYNAPGLPKGTCYVHRIIKEDDVYTTSLIQTISIGFTDDPIWGNESDIRPYGNFIVDTDHNELIVYTLRDNDKVTRFFKFSLPATNVASVVLSTSDIIEYWDTPYYNYIQDGTYQNGKLYVASGYGSVTYPGRIHVVDIMRQKEVTRINLDEIGMTFEPEIIDIYNNSIIFGKQNVYKFVTW